jgi:homoserine kinase
VPSVRARAPASSANLGPGFDTLAVALALHVEVTVEDADALTVVTEGEGSELPADASHLAARIATEVVGHDRLRVTVRSAVPVGRGLGSSAALAAAAAAAAGAPDPLAVAIATDGHPDNAAATVLGGLVAAATVDGAAMTRRLPLDPGLAFVVLVPERRLPTKEARGALPATVPHADAAFNLGRMGLLVAGLADRRLLVRQAAEDRLHQAQRAPLFPGRPPSSTGWSRPAPWRRAGRAPGPACSPSATPRAPTTSGPGATTCWLPPASRAAPCACHRTSTAWWWTAPPWVSTSVLGWPVTRVTA